MGFLRKLFPGAFKLKKKEVKPFVIKLVVYYIIAIVCGVILGTPGGLLLLFSAVKESATLTIISYVYYLFAYLAAVVIGLYLNGATVICILKLVGVIKDQEGDVDNTSFNNAAGAVGGAFDKVVSATEGVVNKIVDKAAKKKDEENKESETASEETNESNAE